jgi:hypothetical protein
MDLSIAHRILFLKRATRAGQAPRRQFIALACVLTAARSKSLQAPVNFVV